VVLLAATLTFLASSILAFAQTNKPTHETPVDPPFKTEGQNRGLDESPIDEELDLEGLTSLVAQESVLICTSSAVAEKLISAARKVKVARSAQIVATLLFTGCVTGSGIQYGARHFEDRLKDEKERVELTLLVREYAAADEKLAHLSEVKRLEFEMEVVEAVLEGTAFEEAYAEYIRFYRN